MQKCKMNVWKDCRQSHILYKRTLVSKIKQQEQQKNLFNIVSGNFKTANCWAQKGNQRSIEHTKNVLEDNVARLEENLGNIESCTGNTWLTARSSFCCR